MVKKTLTVHYFYDPMCGWCYGATTLIEALAGLENINIIYHPGGMVKRQEINSTFKAHILESDQTIATTTGAIFGEAYKSRLKSSEGLVFDSYIAIRAILVAEKLGISPLHMLKAIQEAHFQHGKQVELMTTLTDIAASLDLDKTIWIENMQQLESKETETIQETQKLMNQHQINGYPTLIAETSSGLKHLSHSSYYQNTDGWINLLNSLK